MGAIEIAQRREQEDVCSFATCMLQNYLGLETHRHEVRTVLHWHAQAISIGHPFIYSLVD